MRVTPDEPRVYQAEHHHFLFSMSTLSRDSDSNYVGACQFCNLRYGKVLLGNILQFRQITT